MVWLVLFPLQLVRYDRSMLSTLLVKMDRQKDPVSKSCRVDSFIRYVIAL